MPVRLLAQAKATPAATFVNGSKRPASKPTLNLAAVTRRAQRSVQQARSLRLPPPPPPPPSSAVPATSPRKLRLLHNPLTDSHNSGVPPRPPRRAPAEEDWGANTNHANAGTVTSPSASAAPPPATPTAMPAPVHYVEAAAHTGARAGARVLAAPSPRSEEETAGFSPTKTRVAASVSPSVRLLRRRDLDDGETPLRIASPKATSSSEERGSMDEELWEPFPQSPRLQSVRTPKGSPKTVPKAAGKAAPLTAVLTPASDHSGSLPLGERPPPALTRTSSHSAADSDDVASSGSSQERGLRLLRRSPSEGHCSDENADPNPTRDWNTPLKVAELLREMKAVRRLLEQSPAAGAGVAGVADGALQAAMAEALKTVVGGYLPEPNDEERGDAHEAAGSDSAGSSPQSLRSVAEEETAEETTVGETQVSSQTSSEIRNRPELGEASQTWCCVRLFFTWFPTHTL